MKEQEELIFHFFLMGLYEIFEVLTKDIISWNLCGNATITQETWLPSVSVMGLTAHRKVLAEC